MAGNVFGLNEVYDLQKDNATDLGLNIPGLTRGYWAGGRVNTVTQFEFATETASNPGNNLSQSVGEASYVSSPNYGYVASGVITPPTWTSDIQRLDFSNDTISTPTDVTSNPGIQYAAGVYTEHFGYICGGGTEPGPMVSKVDRLEFSTETVTASTNLPTEHNQAVGIISYDIGYICGSAPTSTRICTISRIDFSNETTAANPTFMPRNASLRGGLSDKKYGYGYLVGGYKNPGDSTYCQVDRIDFSTDSVAETTGFPQKLIYSIGVNSPDYGYLGSNSVGDPPAPTVVSDIFRLDFSTNTYSTPAANTSQTAQGAAGMQVNRPQAFRHVPGNSVWKEEPNYGYSIGGYFGPPNAYSSKIIRLEYGTETATISPAVDVAPVVRTGAAGVYNANYGYAAGGQPGGNISSVSRLEFSTETMQRSTANLTQGRSRLAGASDTNYGYTAGGHDIGDIVQSTIDKLDFSNETVSANPGKLNQARLYLAGTQSDSYGYFGAGRTGPSSGNVCTIERLDFSSGTVSNPPASTTYDGTDMSAFASATNAYFFSGGTPGQVCTISRLDFVTDTSSDNPGQLSQARRDAAGVSNFGFGYAIGGELPGGSTIIDRVDFTTDTVSTPGNIPGDGLRIKSATVNGGIATRRVGKATYGYVVGGIDFPPGGEVSTIDRFEFSTETVTNPSAIGKLSKAVQSFASFSNSEYGYFGGGYSPSVPGNTCLIERLDFSNDTAKQHNSSFQTTRLGAAGIENTNYGYAGGGSIPTTTCTIARLDFSTETVAQPNSYSMTRANRGQGAISGPSYGYFAGGFDGGGSRVCLIDRFDFTTETGDNPAFSLPTAVRAPGGTQNTNDGYFAGGDTPTSISKIFRLDFTTETLTTNPNNLSQARTILPSSSSGDGRYGYFYGGYISSTIDRIEFNSGTVSTPSQKLTSAGRYSAGSVANG